jgi:NAD(P)-dependent dehydrogenase (short-subunit alcohol dehydrogenase family)
MERIRPEEEAMAGLLEGKSALITGGGGGIGRATSLAFAREGARVAVADAAESTAKETVGQINAAGGQAMSLTGDVTSAAAVEAMVKSVVAAYGRLDCAFNNAGIAGFQVDAGGKKTADWSEQSFDRMIAVNLKGVWLCMKHELPQMVAQGGGAIVNTASIAGLIAEPGISAYIAAKHGVIGLSKAAAVEYANKGIRINALAPGLVNTAMTKAWFDDPNMRAHFIANTPIGRVSEPTEITGMVLFLCSDFASFTVGQTFVIDGGYTTH